jgi:hypothetical protein
MEIHAEIPAAAERKGKEKEKKTLKPAIHRRCSAQERPVAAASRQGFSSPKIDWYDQSTSGHAHSETLKQIVSQIC